MQRGSPSSEAPSAGLERTRRSGRVRLVIHAVTVPASPKGVAVSIQLQVVLADYAVTHDGKVMMAGAGWTQVGPGPFSSSLAFMAKVPWDMADQRISIRAELVDEDGRAVLINGSPLALEIAFEVRRPDGVKPGSDIDQNMAVQIPPINLEPGRTYEWRVSVDGQGSRDWNRVFHVRNRA